MCDNFSAPHTAYLDVIIAIFVVVNVAVEFKVVESAIGALN